MFSQRKGHCTQEKSSVFDPGSQIRRLSNLQCLREVLARLRKIAGEIKDSTQPDERVDLPDLIARSLVHSQRLAKCFARLRQIIQDQVVEAQLALDRAFLP